MAIHRFVLEYDETRGRVRVTNEPEKDGYVCGLDFLFDRPRDKADLKSALTQIIIQKSKPESIRGNKYDLTPDDVAKEIQAREEIEAALQTLKNENAALKSENAELRAGGNPNASS